MRYRLRTLLIVTTVVAVLVGLAVGTYRADVAANKRRVHEDAVPIERRNPAP